jgi:hypothetical protein
MRKKEKKNILIKKKEKKNIKNRSNSRSSNSCRYIIDTHLANATDFYQWMTVVEGTSIGNKKIDIWQAGPKLINTVNLNITKSVDNSYIARALAVHSCG